MNNTLKIFASKTHRKQVQRNSKESISEKNVSLKKIIRLEIRFPIMFNTRQVILAGYCVLGSGFIN